MKKFTWREVGSYVVMNGDTFFCLDDEADARIKELEDMLRNWMYASDNTTSMRGLKILYDQTEVLLEK